MRCSIAWRWLLLQFTADDSEPGRLVLDVDPTLHSRDVFQEPQEKRPGRRLLAPLQDSQVSVTVPTPARIISEILHVAALFLEG